MKKVFWDDWLTFRIICEACYDEIADQQWMGPGGYQLTSVQKVEQWSLAGEQMRNAPRCEECGNRFIAAPWTFQRSTAVHFQASR